ncbi:MAG: class I SAM-dependent methyltransferase, partial [Caulobacteraceae bacterium]
MTPKAFPLAAILALLTLAPAAQATPKADHALHAAVEGPRRAAANVARDPWRNPAESLSFWGLKPGATVVELSPGGGYWTEILAPYLKTTNGHYVAAHGGDPEPFKAKYADAAVYGVIETTPLTKDSGPYLPAGSADLVITSRNIHNFIYQGTLDKVMADSFAALKPGGYLGVEEHRADPRPMKPDVSDGYVSEALVIAAAEKAG